MISDHKLGQVIIPRHPISPVKLPLKKMDYPQYCRLLKKMDMPFVRGNEDRHDYGRFEEKYSPTFLKFHPYPSPAQPDYHLYHPYPPPPGKDYPLFPLRDNVPLRDPCSGFMSPGGDADLRPGVGRTIPNLVSYYDVKPQQRVPISDYGLTTETKKRTILLEELNEDPRWNSRKVSDAAIRARLGGWTSSTKVMPDLTKMDCNLSTFKFSFDEPKSKGEGDSICPEELTMEQRVKESFYKSSTQKAYETVPLDRIYPPKLSPPLTTFEKKANHVTQCFTLKRYELAPSISQFVGGLWDRFQTRSFTSPERPINYVSPNSRTQYIPLYTGCVQSSNPDDIDDPNGDLTSLGKARTSRILYTTTSRSANIPGYAGKVHFTATHPANSDIPPTKPAINSAVRRTLWESKDVPNYRHLGPLSKMVTLVDPYNSFNGVVKETVKFFKKPVL